MDIKTFVFLDSETTGLPCHQNNRTRMTELCLTAVQSDHISLSVYPRVQSKVSLCFNPRKLIDADASRVSGLSNDLLEYQAEFGSAAFSIFQEFLNLQRKPICFVAHNGNRFDYPILRAEIHKTGNELPEEILCIDSLIAFRELYHQVVEESFKENACEIPKETPQEVPIEFQDGFDELLCNTVDDLERPGSSINQKLSVEEIQKRNETTPQKQNISNGVHSVHDTKCNNTSNHSGNVSAPVKRKLPFGTPSFRLGEIYKRLTSKEPTDAHKAEYDVTMLIECAAVLGKKFVDWANVNAKRFCDMPVMTPGKKIGS